jgi:hypothetical protein
VFHINAWNYYTSQRRELGTDVEMEGLGPTSELALECDDPPMRRRSRAVPLPGLEVRVKRTH